MKTLKCACGWEVSGTEEEVVTATQAHAERLHNMRASREDVLSRIEAAES
jgi:predicted small metal-binding protein